MTDTNQLPALPDFLSDTHSINAFVESTDEQIRDAFRAYALQARAQVPPAQAEVTDELCWQIWDKAGACDEVNERVTLKVAKPIIRAIVAAYLEVAAPRGITAQAKKETP